MCEQELHVVYHET